MMVNYFTIIKKKTNDLSPQAVYTKKTGDHDIWHWKSRS